LLDELREECLKKFERENVEHQVRVLPAEAEGESARAVAAMTGH
jgi:hypothetical protein